MLINNNNNNNNSNKVINQSTLATQAAYSQIALALKIFNGSSKWQKGKSRSHPQLWWLANVGWILSTLGLQASQF